jgi:hypothetical protein
MGGLIGLFTLAVSEMKAGGEGKEVNWKLWTSFCGVEWTVGFGG